MVRRTEFALLGDCEGMGASSKRPVLSQDLSARHSGYKCRIDATTVFVNGETAAILLTDLMDLGNNRNGSGLYRVRNGDAVDRKD